MADDRRPSPVRKLLHALSTADEEAMRRVRRGGDPQAFGLLVRRWQGPIRRLCERMTGDPHRAEDLAQETFARLLVNAKTYRSSARFSTFLWRIALNLCCDELRKAGRRPEATGDCASEDGPSQIEAAAAGDAGPHALADRRERAELVRGALAALPEHYRCVVVLRHYEGLKFREIAAVLEIPEGTVKSRMAEALNRLRQALGGKLGEDGGEE